MNMKNLHSDEGDLKHLVKSGTFEKKFYSSFWELPEDKEGITCMHLKGLKFIIRNQLYFTCIMPINFTFRHLVTVTILSFRTDRSGQTVQTEIRLLLEEQSDQGLHCLQFCLHILDALLYCKASLSKF